MSETGSDRGPLSTAMAAFLTALSGRGYSLETVATYRIDLRHLLERVGEVAPEKLTSHDIRRALAGLHGQGLQPKTLAHSLSAWRSFFNFLARETGLSSNPCSGLRPPRSERKLPNAPSVDVMAHLLAAETDSLWTVRDLAMFELMYSAGLRRAELIGLDIAGVNLDAGEVNVLGKGSRTRVVPVGAKAVEALRRWLALRANIAKLDTQALFVGTRGARISATALASALTRLAQRQGITAHMHPHALRHAFASHVLQSSGDLRAVQEMLGHASLSTTQIYTHLDFQHLAQVYDQTHPRAKKK